MAKVIFCLCPNFVSVTNVNVPVPVSSMTPFEMLQMKPLAHTPETPNKQWLTVDVPPLLPSLYSDK